MREKSFAALLQTPIPRFESTLRTGFIVDKDSQRERDRQDVLDGIMLKYEYRMKWYGETEEEAKAVFGGGKL